MLWVLHLLSSECLEREAGSRNGVGFSVFKIKIGFQNQNSNLDSKTEIQIQISPFILKGCPAPYKGVTGLPGLGERVGVGAGVRLGVPEPEPAG